MKRAARSGTTGSIVPRHSWSDAGGVSVNLLGPDEADRIPAAYGHNYDRLAELKKVWDPDNLFRNTYNIEPAG